MDQGCARCAGLDQAALGRLRGLLGGNAWFMRAIRAVAASRLPDAWIGAGVIRDVIWGQLFGRFIAADVRDIDVPFFDPADLRMERDLSAQQDLVRQASGLPWEATNQAAVHTWFHQYFGGAPVEPLASVHDAIATWPESATCVAVRLRAGTLIGEPQPADLVVCAPLGLGDLLGGVWRPNSVRVTPEVSMARLARQRVRERWPGVRIELPG